jgi:hypothetical protein
MPRRPKPKTMAKTTDKAVRMVDPAMFKHVERSAAFLIKALCLDTNAAETTTVHTITSYGKSIGRYSVTIKKL